jgi:hypothetical protein
MTAQHSNHTVFLQIRQKLTIEVQEAKNTSYGYNSSYLADNQKYSW